MVDGGGGRVAPGDPGQGLCLADTCNVKMWERAYSRIRWISHCRGRLTHRFRGQARSHFWISFTSWSAKELTGRRVKLLSKCIDECRGGLVCLADTCNFKMWQRACSRIRWISHCRGRLTHRFRGQARSHIWISFTSWSAKELTGRRVKLLAKCIDECRGGLVCLADTRNVKMWERACPRIRWISHCRGRLTHRFRGQARSHIWSSFTSWSAKELTGRRVKLLSKRIDACRGGLVCLADTCNVKMWERACPRIRWISHCRGRLTHRFREQARSHIWISFTSGAAKELTGRRIKLLSKRIDECRGGLICLADHAMSKCGSGLAREYAGSATAWVD